MAKRTAAALLAEIDGLSYGDRVALLARRARTADRAALQDELSAGGTAERGIAVFLAAAAGDGDHLLRALGDPDAELRATALAALLRLGGVPELGPLLRDAPVVTRQAAYRQLRRSGPTPDGPTPDGPAADGRPAADRRPVADGLIGEITTAFGDREAARLLPACSAGTVARLLPELGYAVGNWAGLARRHPRAVLADAARQLAALTPPDRDRWWRRYDSGVAAAAAAAPLEVLDLLERYAPATSLPLPRTAYGVLTAAAPDRVLALLTDPARTRWLLRHPLPRAVLARLGRLEPERLTALARVLREADFALAMLLQAVPPRHRGAVYDAALDGTDPARTRPVDVLLDVLPQARRQAEAARILTLPLVRDDEQATLRYTAYLSWERAEPALTAATRRAAAEDRAAGWDLLLTCAGRTRDPAPVAAAVARLAGLRNEQDPVRSRALDALSRLPAHLLRADSAAVLEQLVADAVTARDHSLQTVTALGHLAAAQLRESPELRDWALSTLDRLFGSGSLPALGRWDRTLRRGQEQAAFAAVRPWLAAGLDRARYEPLFAVTAALGKRARAVPELQDMLGRAVGTAKPDAVVRRAVSLWLADPSTRAERAGAVLRALDRSAITLPDVWKVACTLRTDLLDPALSGRLTGRFVPKRVRWVPDRVHTPRRWLPRQQRAYLRLLTEVATDTGTTTWARQAAIRSAAAIPDGGAVLVRSFVDVEDQALAEAALGALVHTDRPADALPVLLSRLDGDQARVAAYALGRAARFAPPRRLDDALAGIALGRTPAKVTSRKEALRLGAAAAVLAAVVEQPGQHRDVRAAAFATARQHLGDGPMWTLLRTATSREDRLAVLAADPFELPEHRRVPYAELILDLSRDPDPVVARNAWQALAGWPSWSPDLTDEARRRLTDLATTSVWRAVIPAVVARTDAGRALPLLPEVLAALATVDGPDAGPTRDRPARRRLDELVDALAHWAARNPGRDQQPLRAAAQGLAAYGEFVPQAAALRLAAVDLADPGDELAAISDLLADRPVTAARLADHLAGRVGTGDPAAMLSTARGLAERPDTAAGLFAVALATAGAHRGWPADWRALVADLRRSPSADVRATALALPTAAE